MKLKEAWEIVEENIQCNTPVDNIGTGFALTWIEQVLFHDKQLKDDRAEFINAWQYAVKFIYNEDTVQDINLMVAYRIVDAIVKHKANPLKGDHL